MKSRLALLVKGELVRLNKYNFTSISVFVAVVWGAILYFIDLDALEIILPFVLLLDASLMAVMYVGAVMYFEKSESTISTLLVTPITNAELILSKVISYTLHNLLSAVLRIIAVVWLKDIELNYFLIFVGIVVTTAFFTVAGLVLSYFQKDFTGMLVQIMLLGFAFMIPSALYAFGVLKSRFWEIIAYINPISVGGTLIAGGFEGFVFEFEYYYALGYMIFGGLALYFFVALPGFQKYAVKQSGV